MKIVLLLVILGATAWWYFIGGRTLSDADVRQFFVEQEVATLHRAPDELCGLLDSSFALVVSASTASPALAGGSNKQQMCEQYKQMFSTFETLGEKMGGILQLDYGYEIHMIEIAPDRKSAKVDVSYSLDVAGSIMNIRSRSTETLIRRNGKVLMARSEGGASFAGEPGAP
jgi:hypothetical protein